jgi:hypothetical protein
MIWATLGFFHLCLGMTLHNLDQFRQNFYNQRWSGADCLKSNLQARDAGRPVLMKSK